MGRPLFWGPCYIERTVGTNDPYGVGLFFAGTARLELCASVDPCWAWTMDVRSKAKNLRVSIDANRRGDCFQLEVYAPRAYGDPDAAPSFAVQCPEYVAVDPSVPPSIAAQAWQLQVDVPNPKSGAWVVRVVPFGVRDWAFRLRAGLGEPPAGVGAGLPNLQPHAPYEFGFSGPAHPVAGAATDRHNAGRVPAYSCTADEMAEAAGHDAASSRCLRFSAGMYNLGSGPMELLLLTGEGPAGQTAGGAVVQRVRNRDGKVVRRLDAGAWEYHASHNHAHYLGFVRFELYRVSRGDGRIALERVGVGNKTGWNPADQRVATWESFGQEAPNAPYFRCADAGEECITQAAGWGDHYRWQRPGNYVGFPITDTEGHYVVRMIVDQRGLVRETNERDNVAYSWVHVDLNSVTLCRRGLGTSPWDAHRRAPLADYWLAHGFSSTVSSSSGVCPPIG